MPLSTRQTQVCWSRGCDQAAEFTVSACRYEDACGAHLTQVATHCGFFAPSEPECPNEVYGALVYPSAHEGAVPYYAPRCAEHWIATAERLTEVIHPQAVSA